MIAKFPFLLHSFKCMIPSSNAAIISADVSVWLGYNSGGGIGA
jgi:hypothetical protein